MRPRTRSLSTCSSGITMTSISLARLWSLLHSSLRPSAGHLLACSFSAYISAAFLRRPPPRHRRSSPTAAQPRARRPAGHSASCTPGSRRPVCATIRPMDALACAGREPGPRREAPRTGRGPPDCGEGAGREQLICRISVERAVHCGGGRGRAGRGEGRRRRRGTRYS